jgi:Flp pilus assembly protein TadD
MTATRSHFVRLAASTAAIATLLAGCSMGGGDRPSRHAAQTLPGQSGKAIVKAEAAVAANPRSAAARAALGAAYLSAGRFASAAQTYDDAIALGDERVATVLGLALAETALGNGDAARELLRQWKDLIPASDLGLAYALAGETGRGVEIIGEALRAGDGSAKTRQNLAFAYALDGRWREARLMVAQDLPADQVDYRISDWARMAKPEDVQLRVAHLLGTVPSEDPGQPVELALVVEGATAELAAAPEPAAPTEAPPVAPVQQAEAELPATAPSPAAPAPTLAATAAIEGPAMTSQPVVQPIRVASLDKVPMALVRTATAASPTALPAAKPRKVGNYVSPAKAIAQPGRRAVAAPAPAPKVAAGGGTHWIQLGSYTNPSVAGDGWRKFVARTPGLKPYRAVTTTATVNGQQVWRVAATGFVSLEHATRMCRSVRARGGACLVKRAESTPAGGRAFASLRK